MRGVYSVSIDIDTVTTAKTLLYITVPSTIVIEIISASVTNRNNVTNQQLDVGIFRVSSLGTPTAGSTPTPVKTEAGDQASACTVKANVTASEPTYASIGVDEKGVSSLAGYYYDPLPEERPIIAPGATVGLRLTTAPTSFNATARIVWREIG
jgi:hypothetical protein